MTNKTVKELEKIISMLPVEDLISIHDWYCNTDGNPNNYIYEMSRFNEMNEDLTPKEIVSSLSDSFNPNDKYFWYGENEKIFSFSYKKDLRKTPCESNFIYADWLLDTETKVYIDTVDLFVEEAIKKMDEKWKEIHERLKNMIDEKVNEIFYDLQTELEIESGDINPMQLLRLEETESNLSDIMLAVLRFEKEWF